MTLLRPFAIVNYAIAKGVRGRGHTLVWGKFSGRTYPKELDKQIAETGDPAAELQQILRSRRS